MIARFAASGRVLHFLARVGRAACGRRWPTFATAAASDFTEPTYDGARCRRCEEWVRKRDIAKGLRAARAVAS